MHQDRRRAWARAVLVPVALLALLVVLAPAAAAQTAGDSALRSFTAAVASAGKFFLGKVGQLIYNTTSPNVVTAGWFTSQYRVMLALAVVIALPILLVSVA